MVPDRGGLTANWKFSPNDLALPYHPNQRTVLSHILLLLYLGRLPTVCIPYICMYRLPYVLFTGVVACCSQGTSGT